MTSPSVFMKRRDSEHPLPFVSAIEGRGLPLGVSAEKKRRCSKSLLESVARKRCSKALLNSAAQERCLKAVLDSIAAATFMVDSIAATCSHRRYHKGSTGTLKLKLELIVGPLPRSRRKPAKPRVDMRRGAL